MNASSQVDFPTGKDGFSQSQSCTVVQALWLRTHISEIATWDRDGERPGAEGCDLHLEISLALARCAYGML